MTDNQKKLLDFLGSDYSLLPIDGEPCIYRRLNDKFDIEVSGTKRANQPLTIFLWDISQRNPRIIETRNHVENDKQLLKTILDELSSKYLKVGENPVSI